MKYNKILLLSNVAEEALQRNIWYAFRMAQLSLKVDHFQKVFPLFFVKKKNQGHTQGPLTLPRIK